MTPAVEPAPRGRRFGRSRWSGRESVSPIVAVAIGFVILTLLTSIVVVFGGSGTNRGADSPDQVVLNWVAAVNQGDYDTADSYLSQSQPSGRSFLLASSIGLGMKMSPDQAAPPVEIESVSVQGDHATVRVSVKFSMYGVDIGYPGTVGLVKEAGAWKIDSVTPNY